MTTPNGLPYPDSTDDLNQGANDIKALALALDARGGAYLFQGGERPSSAFGSARAWVTFPTPFKAGTKPAVLAMGGSGSTPNNTILAVAINEVNNTSFEVICSRQGATAGAATDWVANGEIVNIAFLAWGTPA